MKQVIHPDDINRILEDAWLDIKVDEEKLFNPLAHIPPELQNEPHLYIIWLFTQPEYFYFFCKEICNVQLLPFQAVILKELWNRRFPMLVGCRGLSKSFLLGLYALMRMILLPGRQIILCASAFRQAKIIFNYMESIWANAPLLRDLAGSRHNIYHEPDMHRFTIDDSRTVCIPTGSGEKIRGQRAHDLLVDEMSCLGKTTLIQTNNGLMKIKDYLNGEVNDLLNMNNEFETPEKIFMTPLTDVYKVTVQNGYSFQCSSIHKVMTIDGWKIAKDLTQNDFLELDCNDYFPDRYVTDGDFVLNEDIGWIMGLLIAEGDVTKKYMISVEMTNKNIIDKLAFLINKNFGYICSINTRQRIDKRGWILKRTYVCNIYSVNIRDILLRFGMDYCDCYTKEIPPSILMSPKSVIISFLNALFIGDGCAYINNQRRKNNKIDKVFTMKYDSASLELISQLQVLLLKFHILSRIIYRRGNKLSNNITYMLQFNRLYSTLLQKCIKVEKFNNILLGSNMPKRLKENFGVHKCLKNKLWVVQIAGYESKYFKCVQEAQIYAKKCLDNYFNKRFFMKVKSVQKLAKQEVLYDFYLPQTHSFYGNGFVQHNSLNREIFENVMAGFLTVRAGPVGNVIATARRKLANKMGYQEKESDIFQVNNQLIISGTAYYDFNHFADYWRRWKKIIHSKGDKGKLREIFDGADPPEDLDWRDYSIIRIPYELVPKGFMDEAMIARAKATVHSGIYKMEYGSVFSNDSNGFFKRSLIESCVISHKNEIVHQSGIVDFHPSLFGNPSRRYVYGVDPASEEDRFAIVVLEVQPDHRRIVYVWTTIRSEHREKVKAGLIKQTDFYGYCARKIRDLMYVFPCERIVMDSQGGGRAVAEALHDVDKLKEGEYSIWPILIPLKKQETDAEVGLHILELANFSSADWTSEANHGLKKDFEDKICLFPKFDPALIELASIKDANEGRLYDTLEDCVLEIEELKDELSTIIIEKTPLGRDRWCTPEIKLTGNKKGKMRKDRYSALVMANMGARVMARTQVFTYHISEGGFVSPVKGTTSGPKYVGPDWFVKSIEGVYD